MIDGKLAQAPSTSPGADAGRNRPLLRERVREIIRDEVAKLHPTDDARRALELIIESSVRYTEVDGEVRISVVGKDGKPRTIDRNGRTDDFTIHDLLDELRASHPILFKSPVEHSADAHATGSAPEASEKPKVFSDKPAKPERDWLSLGPGEASADAGASHSGESGAVFHLRRGRVRLHGWSRKALAGLRKTATPGETTTFQFVPDGFSRSADWARNVIDGMRTRPLSGRRGLALAAIAVAALLGIGAIVLSGRHDAPSRQARTGEPATTGTVSAPAQTASAEAPASASSQPQTLRGVPDVVDTATLSLQGEVVRLFGVEWAPGGGKPEDLTRYLQGREVVCEPAGPNDVYRCQVGGQDLSRVVLFNGGGKPTAEATPELKAAADKAREAKIGVWGQ